MVPCQPFSAKLVMSKQGKSISYNARYWTDCLPLYVISKQVFSNELGYLITDNFKSSHFKIQMIEVYDKNRKENGEKRNVAGAVCSSMQYSRKISKRKLDPEQAAEPIQARRSHGGGARRQPLKPIAARYGGAVRGLPGAAYVAARVSSNYNFTTDSPCASFLHTYPDMPSLTSKVLSPLWHCRRGGACGAVADVADGRRRRAVVGSQCMFPRTLILLPPSSRDCQNPCKISNLSRDLSAKTLLQEFDDGNQSKANFPICQNW